MASKTAGGNSWFKLAGAEQGVVTPCIGVMDIEGRDGGGGRAAAGVSGADEGGCEEQSPAGKVYEH